ncbi:beta-glucoside-specific PTS transporter subunit IIABC [Schleiferilactobacillus shenzhenensis]|uniref:PTS system sucrose-specific EIIBCA component n=1 Tax=Schleiferilactobacillus shenzhenensis LY-73 TaxID=1231336 RepID=U4TXK5_9LACO|nr:beta-glucoside-specific PTS transporter subunit IIABC [Schleiferilactobacillus shenzhenensis]ERL66082.1 BglP [Schleiferilactobacillus shenzhenensis LY-73]
MDQKALAQGILQGVGGKDNIEKAWHCATRMRFYLKDEKKADTAAVEKLDGVITVVKSAGQYQVVIGNAVADVFDQFANVAGISDDGTQGGTAQKEEKKAEGSLINRFIGFISGVFTPFLGAMAGAGILKGLLALFTALGWLSTKSGTYEILYAASDGLFYFLPIFLAFTAAKQLHVSQFIAVALGATLVYPTLVAAAGKGTTLHFLGIPVVSATYTSTVIPILLAIWVLSYLEPLLNKIFPEAVRTIFTPLFSLLIMAPLTLIVVGPVGTAVSNVLAAGVMGIYNFMPWLAGAIMGAFWQVFVIFGVHWTFVPLMMNNIAKMGYDPLLPILAAAVLSQGGAALGVFLKSKDEKMKALAGSGVITSLFGITEPTIYGVTLKLKRPFYCAVASGAIGGAIIGAGAVHTSSFALPSLLAIPGYTGNGVVIGLLGVAVAFFGGAVLSYLFGIKKEDNVAAAATVTSTDGALTVQAPVAGTLIPLKNVNDEVFATEAMGQGIAIVPTADTITAPVSGVVSVLYPTGHAIGITADNGVELLIHIGINTVELNGQYFEALTKQNAHVKVGDPLVKANFAQIKAAGYDTTVMVIVTNTNSYAAVTPTAETEAAADQTILTMTPAAKTTKTTEGVTATNV